MIYVDYLFQWPRKHQQYCHMSSNISLEELKQFAKKINIKRFDKRTIEYLAHYDLTEEERNRAIENGATVVTTGELITLCKYKCYKI